MARKLAFVVKWTRPDGEPDLATFSTRAEAMTAMQHITAPARMGLYMVGTPEYETPLSEAQRDFLARMMKTGYSVAPGGFHNAAIAASAWWRTSRALVDRGLVVRDSNHVYFTLRGIAFASEAS